MQKLSITMHDSVSIPYVGRLAPAPTGALHLGNARTFLVAWLRARLSGGKLLLRLEDLDHPKVKPHAAKQAYLDLAWLGLDWDEGPAASFPPYDDLPLGGDPYVQSQRLAFYQTLLDDLKARGLIYPCVCTRKDLENSASAPNGGEDLLEKRYPGTCRERFTVAGGAYVSDPVPVGADGRGVGWRFKVNPGEAISFVDGFAGPGGGVLSEWSGDFVIARGDRAGYQLAVVADDHAMGVTEVVRGDDLLASTQRQLVLYRTFAWPPPAFFHLPIVAGPDGRRLAKRHGDTRLSVLRERGEGPDRVLGWLAWSCGWTDGLREISLAEIRERATTRGFAGIPREKIIVSPDALHWLGFV